MALHPTRDNADETDGKYSTDEKMTFEEVLKSSLRERAEQQETLDELVEKDRGATPPEREAEKRREHRREAAKQQREEIDSEEREALATAIGEAHVSTQPSYRIATGETDRIGLSTAYEFAKTTINDRTYYYIVQITEQSYKQHEATLAVKDFGTEWSYSIPTIDTDALQDAIARQRQADLRQKREPVAWVTESQIDTIEKWYQARTESALLALEERSRREGCTVHVLDQYLVADVDEESLVVGNDLEELTNRQINVVIESLLNLVKVDTDMPPVLYEDVPKSIDYPLLAQITFDHS